MDSVDLFAGFGGNAEGAKNCGLNVVFAANHDPMVVDVHTANHPETIHACQDLQQMDWALVPDHHVLLASPCCQGFTNARGREGDRKAHYHRSRSTAFAPLSCAEYHSSEIVYLECVPELLDWTLFPQWVDMWEALGYSVATFLLDAADFGVPQHRERVYIICTRSKNPIELTFAKQDHVGFIDIYEEDSAAWSPINKPGRSKKTLRRIENGRARFGDFFLAPYYSSGSGLTGRDINRPLGTVTCKDRWSIINGDQMRMVSVPEYRRAMGFPADMILPSKKADAVHGLGNATCPKVVTEVLTAVLKAA
ncbi:DNA methyltransferase [Halioglobus sp. HI00S01]|nr:DNA methyltransferase [Halioglobus sp. HI00S01]